MQWSGIINYYRDYLPVTKKTPVITLLEGNTPLIPAKNLSKEFDGRVQIYLKYEGLNPTASFKDRGMTVAVSCALERGARAVICASTGNTSASAAAYAARAKISCVVLIPKDAVALGKLSQALVHGAQVIAVDGNFDDTLTLVKEITSKYPITLVNSLNPHRIEGQKTATFEICDVLGGAPHYQAMPVGNAGNITAYWKGYKEYQTRGKIQRLPKILGFQAAKSAPIVDGHAIRNPHTIATAIRIGNPARWAEALRVAEESKGLIEKVEDKEILKAYGLLADREGIFVEPASAISLAGIMKLHQRGYFESDLSTAGSRPIVVCILTGHGLKDPDRAIKESSPPVVVPSDEKKIMKVISKEVS